jgi:uncharacterized protein (TIGR03437 family)
MRHLLAGLAPTAQLGFSLALAGLPVLAQKPVINPNGVVNAATYVPSPEDGHALAPGSIAAIFGRNLAVATAQAQSTPLPANLAGTSVTINGVAAPLFYVSPTQINLQVPAAVPMGTANGYSSVPVVVTTAAGPSQPVMVDTYYVGTGIFTLNGSGCGQAAVLNVKADGTVSLNGPSNSASPGDYLEVFGTGFGAPKTAIPDGTPAPAATPDYYGNPVYGPGLVLAGTALSVSIWKAPGLVGVDQINARVPQGAMEGCAVPLLSALGDLFGPPVVVRIHSGGGQCVDPPLGTLGHIKLKRVAAANATPPSETDTFSAWFDGSPGKSLPPPAPPLIPEGAYTVLGGDTAATPPCTLPGYVTLDAGMITFQGPSGPAVAVAPALLGGRIAYQETLPTGGIESGSFGISAEGGTNVGPFQMSLAVGAPIQITSQFPAGTYIDPSKPFTVAWQGGAPGSVVTVWLISNFFLGNSVLEAQADASVGSITMQPIVVTEGGMSEMQLPIITGPNVEVIVDVGPDPTSPLTFASPGLTLGGLLDWMYEYDFPGLTLLPH